MRRYYLVQDWFLGEDGDSTLKGEYFYTTLKEADFFAGRLRRKLNGFHSVDIVVLIELGRSHLVK